MNGSVTYEGLILQGGINVDTAANLEELTVYENGVYNPSTGKDGFSKVTVDVPAAVLDDISITENGHYTPPIGVDGYNDIVVNVPHPAPVLDDITITENGSYQPPTGVDGYDNITVNVPAPAPVLDDITITSNGTYTPPTGTDGYDEITVNVPLPANGIYKHTLSGLPASIATFTGADAPLDSLKASIVGTQDLHGYDSPWPAGGGKNKLPLILADIKSANTSGTWSGNTYTLNGVTFKVLTDSADNVEGIKINGTATANVYFDLVQSFNSTEYAGMIANFIGAVSGVWMRISTSNRVALQEIFGVDTVIADNGYNLKLAIRVEAYGSPNTTICPMIRLATETDSTFAPYSNICPISGWSSCEVTVNNDTYTIPFKDSSDNPITVYGGGIDITRGKLTVTHANIASYNGETINEPWISSEDAYSQGAIPTTGAQVVYQLATPLVYDFDPLALRSNGVTNISVNCGEVTECKYYSETP